MPNIIITLPIELKAKHLMNKKQYDKAFSNFIRRDKEEIEANTFFQILSEIEQERIHENNSGTKCEASVG